MVVRVVAPDTFKVPVIVVFPRALTGLPAIVVRVACENCTFAEV
jgi:hypothetical protein